MQEDEKRRTEAEEDLEGEKKEENEEIGHNVLSKLSNQERE